MGKREADLEAEFGSDGRIRVFSSGATRSPLGDKLQYEGYLNPLVLKRFAEYMKHHQTDSAGNQRDPDNWQRGIPVDALMDSLVRHVMDIWLHHRGYGAETSETREDTLCAIMFNTMALLKNSLGGRGVTPP